MIRDATPTDIPRLEAIRSVALPESSSQLLAYAIRGPALTLVACDGRRLNGYALALTDDQRVGAYLADLAVAPAARRQGYGRALVEAVAQHVAAHDHLELTTRATDERARAFYRDAGFSSVEWLPDHYNNDDGVRLLRPL